MQNEIDLLNEADKLLSRESLLDFTRYTFLDYKENWHHINLADKLDKFARGKIKNLMVFMPPQHGKSELVSRRLPAYLMGIRPDNKIVMCSYSAALSLTFATEVQRIIDGDEYKELFPNTYLSSDIRNTQHKKYTETKNFMEVVGYAGYLKSVGVGGSLTGTTADIGIIDDPVKDYQDAQSELQRERVWNWYESVFKTRMHNSSQMLLTMTRWHEDDLAGRILEAAKESGEKWDIVVYPAIKEAETMEGDPRKEGEALWENRHSLERLLVVKQNSKKVFTSLYQQKPSPDDGDIWKRWFIVIEDKDFPDESSMRNYGTDWDLAYTEKRENSASAYVTAGSIDGNMYIDKLGFVRHEFPNLIKFMSVIPSPHYIEAMAAGKSAKQTLQSMGISAIEVQVFGGDKIARANIVTPYAEGGLCYIRKSLVDLLYYDSTQGILKFPNGKNDDLADALSQAMSRQFKKRQIWAA